MALRVHAYGADHDVVAEYDAVDVNDHQRQLVKTPRQDRRDFGFRGFHHLPAHARLGNANGVGHLRDDAPILARGNASHQNVQHPRSQPGLMVHGGVCRDLNLLAGARTFLAESRPLHGQLAVAEHHAAGWLAVPHHFPCSLLSLLTRTASRLLSGQLQDGLDGGAAGHIDQIVAGQAALLNQIHHGQKELPVLGEERSQLGRVALSLLVDCVIASSHGGSS